VGALYEAARESIAEIYPWMAWCHPRYARDDARTWVESRPAAWERGDDHSYLVTERTSARLLGGIGLNHFDWMHRRANLGYWVRTSATRQGVASEATRMLARMGFAELGLVRIEIVAAVDNLASRRVAEKAGAAFECIARKRLIVPAGPVDAAVYSLVAEDLRE